MCKKYVFYSIHDFPGFALKKNKILLEAVDLLEPGDAVDGKLICEPQLVGRKEPNVSRCFPSRLEIYIYSGCSLTHKSYIHSFYNLKSMLASQK